jgi:hypothetical protein
MPKQTTQREVHYWELDAIDDMFEVLKELPSKGFRGDISIWPEDDGFGCGLMMNGDVVHQHNVEAKLGQVVIWDGSFVSVVAKEEFNG